MFLNLAVPAYSVRDYSPVMLQGGELADFPILTIDRDSYIVGAQLQTSLDMNPGKLVHNLQIGKHSSLATDILFMMDLDKDYYSVSTGIISEYLDIKSPIATDKSRKHIRRKGQILIQNDVWIGHGATILGGATIRNGAVVATRAVVTKDVPPYAIVAGNPARVVKYRFPPEIITALQKIAWWDWDSGKLEENYENMRGDAAEFVEKHLPEAEARMKNRERRPNPVDTLASGKKYAFRVDMHEKYPVLPRVIEEFCSRFQNMDGQLVLYIAGDKEQELNAVMKLLAPWQEKDCAIQIIDDDAVDMVDIIRNTDVYITNRSRDNIYNTCLADVLDKEVISGVDFPIF